MLYKVQTNFHEDLLEEFYKNLNNGTIQNQEPDGPFIVSAMKEAKFINPTTLSWYEECFCATPFAHERETVYNTYFHNFQTQIVESMADDIHGNSFWDYLKTKSSSQ